MPVAKGHTKNVEPTTNLECARQTAGSGPLVRAEVQFVDGEIAVWAHLGPIGIRKTHPLYMYCQVWVIKSSLESHDLPNER